MKKKIIIGIASCFLLLATFINYQQVTNNEGNGVSLKNLVAMTQAQGESAGLCEHIYSVTYSGSVGTSTGITITCTTGSTYKCPLCII